MAGKEEWSRAQQMALKDALNNTWFNEHGEAPGQIGRVAATTLRILREGGLVEERPLYTQQYMDSLRQLQAEDIQQAKNALSQDDWEGAYLYLRSANSRKNKLERTAWFITDAGRAGGGKMIRCPRCDMPQDGRDAEEGWRCCGHCGLEFEDPAPDLAEAFHHTHDTVLVFSLNNDPNPKPVQMRYTGPLPRLFEGLLD